MLQLPPLNLPIRGDISHVTQAVRQVEQLVSRATGNAPTVKVDLDTQGAVRGATQLIHQMKSITAEMRATEQAMGATKQNIAALIAEQARLRAEMANTANQMRQQGASARDIQTALGQARVQFQLVGAALAEQRRELTSSQAAHQQYRSALADTRTALKQLELGEQQAGKTAKQQADEHVSAAQRIKGAYESIKGNFLGGVIFGAGAKVGSTVADFGLDKIQQGFSFAKDSIIGFNASLEQSRIAFTTFLGSAQAADRFLAQLQQFAMQTPFDFPGLLEAAKRMMAFGFSAQQVIPMLTAVGNVAASLGSGTEGIDRITLALGQMQAKGVVLGQDLRQLQEAGVRTGEIFDIMAKKSGTTTAQIQSMQEQGTLSSRLFIAAFQEWSNLRFGDMMEKQNRTFLGAMSNIRDAAQQVLARIGAPFFQAVSRAAQALSTFTQTPAFAAWAQRATVAVQGVIHVLGTLAGVAAEVGRAVLGAFGINLPRLDLSAVTKATQEGTVSAKERAAASDAASEKEAESVRQMTAYGEQAAAAGEKVKGIDRALGGVRDKQDALRTEIEDTTRWYEDQIAALNRQVAAIDKLTPDDRARRDVSNRLAGEEIQLKLSIPDTTGMDDQLRELNRRKEDLQRFDTSQWDKPLDGLRRQLKAISREDTKELDDSIRGVQKQIADLGRQDTKGLDDSIRGVQKQIADLGKQTTRDLDDQVQALRDKIDAISDAEVKGIDKQVKGLQDRIGALNTDDLDRRLDDLKAKLSDTAPDTTGISNQMAVLATQIQGGAGAAAMAAFGNLSVQKQQILSNFQASQTGIKGQIAALEEERRIRQRANEDERASVDATVKGLEAQKAAIELANQATRDRYEQEIKGIESVKRQRDRDAEDARAVLQDRLEGLQEEKRVIDAGRQAERDRLQAQLEGLQETKRLADEDRDTRRQGVQDQIDGIEEAKQAAQDAHAQAMQNLEDEIRSITRQKEDLLLPYEQVQKRIDREKQVNDLLQQQSDLAKKIAEQPLKDKVDELKLAEEDALKPLQDRQRELDRENRTLEASKRYWDGIKADAEDAAKAAQAAMQNIQPPGGQSPDDSHLGAFGAGSAVDTSGITSAFDTIDNRIRDFEGTLRDLKNWWDQNFDSAGKLGVALATLAIVVGLVASPLTGVLVALVELDIATGQYKKDWDALVNTIETGGKIFQIMGDIMKGDWNKAWQDIQGVQREGTTKLLDGQGEYINRSEREVRTTGVNQRGLWNSFFQDKENDQKQHLTRFGQANRESIEDTFGADSWPMKTIRTWLTNVDNNMHDTFDPGGRVGRAFDALGTMTNRHFGPDGIFAGHMESARKAVHNVFGEGGGAQQAWEHTQTWVSSHFGPGGDVVQWFEDNGSFPNALSTAAGWVGAHFGERGGILGTFGTFMTSLGGIFGPVGSFFHLFDGIGSLVSGGLSKANGPINSFLSGVGNAIHAIGNFFHIDALSNLPIPQVSFGGGGNSGAGSGGGDAALATGNLNWRGGPAIIGEAGRELYRPGGGGPWQMADRATYLNLPAGSTVLPNDITEHLLDKGVPGFAFGLGDLKDAIGDFLGKGIREVGDLAGDALSLARSGAGAVYDHTVGNLIPDLDIAALPGLGGMLTDTAKEGAKTLIGNALSRVKNLVAPPSGSAGGGPLGPLVGIIRKYADQYGLPADIIGAIILHESGGIIGRREVGGGNGHGLMQVDTGYWPFDPRLDGTSIKDADFQIEYGSRILKGFLDQYGDIRHALTGYTGAGFITSHGRDFYQELTDMGMIAAADAALAAPMVGAGMAGPTIPGPGGQFIRPVNGTVMQGSGGAYSHAGRVPGFYAIDFGVPRGTPIRSIADAIVSWVGFNDRSGQTGPTAVLDHAAGFQSLYGHLSQSPNEGLQLNQGDVFARSGDPGIDGGYGRGAHLHFELWRDGVRVPAEPYLGLKHGAYVTEPTVAMVGEGGEPEIVAPERKMRQVVREESANGGGFSFHFEDGAITVAQDGGVVVDPTKVSVKTRMRRQGFPG